MIPANDILGRRNEIKDCIAAADMDNAVKRLIDFVRDFQISMEDEVILLCMEYSELVKEERLRLEQREDIKITKRQIAYRILMTLNEACKTYEKGARA